MKRRTSSFAIGFVLIASVIPAFLLVPATSAASTPATFIKEYSNILNNVRQSLTPADVQTTSDGGSIALASTDGGVSWLVKLDPSGAPQWQEELGVFGLPPGSYALGLSVQQTTDGGYIVGGGTLGGGSTSACPPTSGIQCAYVEKLDSGGRIVWAQAYPAGAGGSSITQIKQSSDGGYIAVGSTNDVDQNVGALILKLDATGRVLWR